MHDLQPSFRRRRVQQPVTAVRQSVQVQPSGKKLPLPPGLTPLPPAEKKSGLNPTCGGRSAPISSPPPVPACRPPAVAGSRGLLQAHWQDGEQAEGNTKTAALPNVPLTPASENVAISSRIGRPLPECGKPGRTRTFAQPHFKVQQRLQAEVRKYCPVADFHRLVRRDHVIFHLWFKPRGN